MRRRFFQRLTCFKTSFLLTPERLFLDRRLYQQAMRVAIHTQIRQAMRVLIHTHISCRLLVEGSAPKPLLNTEFHSVAARSANALEGYAEAPPL